MDSYEVITEDVTTAQLRIICANTARDPLTDWQLPPTREVLIWKSSLGAHGESLPLLLIDD